MFMFATSVLFSISFTELRQPSGYILTTNPKMIYRINSILHQVNKETSALSLEYINTPIYHIYSRCLDSIFDAIYSNSVNVNSIWK